MAGSERSGFEAASERLFEGAICVITPTGDSAPDAVAAVADLWKGVGARLKMMPPDEHDDIIGRVSHLPHAAAAALVTAIAMRVPDAGAFAGGGYRDSTRIAASPSAIWTEILLANRTAVLAGLDDFTAVLKKLKTAILSGDAQSLEELLARARTLRSALL